MTGISQGFRGGLSHLDLQIVEQDIGNLIKSGRVAEFCNSLAGSNADFVLGVFEQGQQI